ncbi:linear amide C-N hydrolase [Lysobacter yananisis]|uniref:Linear amide C-N hydrolase n=1 Tax=Lysobacter yananisis TaxID=1003114 RepID=A0ABY9P6F9_9GAMM|nr:MULTISPECIES: linear amide C-N hydrolase [Lysobacter]UZW58865.1 linear amide C-N hydrolase [Lysobacter enzymogenes]WMT02586.1 linear amide C-N hydrolase [Lysobacter yananisis]
MCTNFLLSVPNVPSGSPGALQHITARCMELTGTLATRLYRVPAQQKFPIFRDHSQPWTGQYGFVALADPETMPEFTTFIDGINQAGLSCAALWLPGTQYATQADSGEQPVAFHDFVAWVMSQFDSVPTLVSALANVRIVGPQPDAPTYLPVHFIATDSQGLSAVIECIGGQTIVYGPDYRNGATNDAVLTNAPTYDWHRSNLEIYEKLSVVGSGTSRKADSGPPVGAGTVGLPGDITSPSRFIKAWFLRKGLGLLPRDGKGWLPTAKLDGATDSTQTVVNVALQLVQIVQATPYGTALVSSDKHPLPQQGDWTMWQVARDHTNAVYYFNSAFNATVQRVDLSQLDFGGGSVSAGELASVQVMPAPGPWYNDLSAQF